MRKGRLRQAWASRKTTGIGVPLVTVEVERAF